MGLVEIPHPLLGVGTDLLAEIPHPRGGDLRAGATAEGPALVADSNCPGNEEQPWGNSRSRITGQLPESGGRLRRPLGPTDGRSRSLIVSRDRAWKLLPAMARLRAQFALAATEFQASAYVEWRPWLRPSDPLGLPVPPPRVQQAGRGPGRLLPSTVGDVAPEQGERAGRRSRTRVTSWSGEPPFRAPTTLRCWASSTATALRR